MPSDEGHQQLQAAVFDRHEAHPAVRLDRQADVDADDRRDGGGQQAAVVLEPVLRLLRQGDDAGGDQHGAGEDAQPGADQELGVDVVVDVAGRAETVHCEDAGDAEEGQRQEHETRLAYRLRDPDDRDTGDGRGQRCAGDDPEVAVHRAPGLVVLRIGEQEGQDGHRRGEDGAPHNPPTNRQRQGWLLREFCVTQGICRQMQPAPIESRPMRREDSLQCEQTTGSSLRTTPKQKARSVTWQTS